MENMKASIPTRQSVTTMLMDFEDGSMNVDQTLELFSILIQTGLAWRLQGSYGRMARHLIDQGSLSDDGTITHESLPF
tara:strand:- start:6467 stop:6700 length:234 start_codon:yes stop_codon:yes gene_type:complete